MDTLRMTPVKKEIEEKGFTILHNIYTHAEVEQLLFIIEGVDKNNRSFRSIDSLFAARQFLIEVPAATTIIFNQNLRTLITAIFGKDYYVVKSIYFDKPHNSNWFVSYHRDLTISVNAKNLTQGYIHWTKKPYGFAVQPPLSLLEKNFTVRIHLDDTNENNGALKVIPGSHCNNLQPGQTRNAGEVICSIQRGGVMLMKPLLLHASGRTTNGRQRRVIHIEFSNAYLPEGLEWSEKLNALQ